MRGIFGMLFGGTFAVGMMGLYIGGFIGWCWWMWMAIHFGSFWMFVFGLAGPTGLIAALLGLWSLLFGIPMWRRVSSTTPQRDGPERRPGF